MFSRWVLGVPIHIMRTVRMFTKLAGFSLTQGKANVFDPQHLQGASSKLVQLMFKIGQKAAELERTKLQSEIQKEQSELRQKRSEKCLTMASKCPGKGSATKNPKRHKKDEEEEEEIEDLEEMLEESTGKSRRKTSSLYSKLETGEFVTKDTNRKVRLDK